MRDQRHLPMPDTNGWPACALAWDDILPGPTDMAHLLHRPAGRHGFVKAVDGHLAFAEGGRFRIWGQHLCRAQAVPPKPLAPIIARRLAKFGINCVRLHAIDDHWPYGILQRDADGSRHFDDEGLERLDWLVACLKEQGVYLDLNLHVARTFSAADGVKHAEAVGWGKPEIYFDPHLLALLKEHARGLLHHRNPFTHLRYVDEPAVALLEITNENSLTERWRNGDLKGGSTCKKTNWGAVHTAYAEDLDRRWNAWLGRQYPEREAMATAWAGGAHADEDPARGTVRRLGPEEFAAASARRFHDEASFYAEIERSFFLEMRSFLRDELGAPQLILGSADHNFGWNAVQVASANTVLDLTDSHFYWQHPQDGAIENTPMVDQPDRCAIAHLSRGAVEGYPHLCTEVNEPFPNDAAAEFIPTLAAYARLQDWDGVFFYDYLSWRGSYSQEEAWAEQRQHDWFDIANHPVKMAQTAVGALMFLRGDVQCACRRVKRDIPLAWATESVRRSGPADREHPYWLPYLPGRLALTHRVRIANLDAARIAPAEGEVSLPEGPIVSDTGELTWETAPGDGRLLIDAPRQQAIIGRPGERSTRNLLLRLATPFVAVQLASLDDHPIAQAERLLLVVGARVANTDQTWADDSRQKPSEWGHAPVRIEPVTGTLLLHGLIGARRATAYALDGHGQPAAEGEILKETAAGFQFKLGDAPPSPWYLLRIDRASG
jgi:hypothetical protein